MNSMIGKNKHIGIWGFGVVGKAAVNYLHMQGYSYLAVMDKRTPTHKESLYLQEKNIRWYGEHEKELFFSSHDYIIPSPGINIDHICYATHKDKWIHELDFFYTTFNKPIIAITGSVGKTSTTYILDYIFKELSISVAVGGNIGTATFDLINQQDRVNYALLEVSSFQLQHCKQFAPTLAIWTNFYPNHLDHHADEGEYLLAKYNILKYQTKNDFSLIPFLLRDRISPACNEHFRSYFITSCPNIDELTLLTNNEQVYYIQHNHIMRYKLGLHTIITTLTEEICNFSFIDNILVLAAACDVLHVDHSILHTIATTKQLPSHRIERVASINNIDFYNDSKATTTASTLAAIKKLHHRPLHLFLGGLSKGVDRAPFIAQLKNDVKYVYCFGKEASLLHDICRAYNIPSTSFTTLNEAMDMCIKNIQPHDCILLSPAGSSYDLYDNYEQRGNHFKELVMKYVQKYQ